MPDLTKVKTGGIGPSGETIFDVFSGDDHIKDPNDPRLKGIHIPDLPDRPEGAPADFKSQFPAVITTDKIRDGLGEAGLDADDISDLEGDEDVDAFVSDVNKRLKRNDDIVTEITGLAGPTVEEQDVEADIETLENELQNLVEGVEERPLSGTVLKSGIAAEINNITQGNTRESLVLLRRMGQLEKKLTRLQGDRQAQFDALKLEYDLGRQNVQDAINFYKLTAPEQLAINEETGQVWFRNPLTGEVSVTQLPDFEAPEEEKETKFETRNVNGRTIRFGFDSEGNIVSRKDLGKTTGVQDTDDDPGSINQDTVARNLNSVGLDTSIITSGNKLTKANKDKIVGAGVPPSIVDLITQSIIEGNTLDEIRQALKEGFGQDVGFGYLDTYMQTLQDEGGEGNPFE